MSRIILVVAALALLAKDASAACSQSNANHKKSCQLWNELMDAFQKAGWNKCADFATDGGPCNGCPKAEGYITCSSYAITSITVGSSDGWVFDQSYDIENLNTAIANLGTVNSISMPDIAGLNLNQCVDACASTTCDFSNSGCTGSCTSDGVCVPTSAPTMMPTMTPTSAPTSGPTEETSPTPLPTEASSPTDSPTASPTEAPTMGPTEAPTLDIDIREDPDCDFNSTNCTLAPTIAPTANAPSASSTMEIGLLSAAAMLISALW
ncbi:Hypothetical Protein FCC1311_009762 [Hondaea fermentalgiana]|uniref:Uncharacterized protein n=1 Tax=Hondaea fermentalgiana TaxID=2315210 RepID=A0A2R5G4P1_9STRA|nr:Hypothetical Protein FCC1311_009762 [Hondaea fermentalgiana]|eukprot:GBG24758.1 Hypothetical Protein FCC1311_009762 [Hondaea fermentalgiana]